MRPVRQLSGGFVKCGARQEGISIGILLNRLRLVRKPAKTPGPTDGEIFRRALGIGLVGVAAVVAFAGLTAGPKEKVAAFFSRFSPPAALAAVRPEPTAPVHLFPEPLSAELRKKGYHECYPHDPIGLGPYRRYKNLSMGRIAIPQRGGHTEDMGYDVLIQFHGYSPVRKTLVQVARGLTYVGIDRGIGSGAYSDAFGNPDVFKHLVASIEATLKKQSGDRRAHIRHLALSAWSAGYGAVNEILKYEDSRIDAVILLDGLHAAWNPMARNHESGVASLSDGPIAPTFRFAKEAVAGRKLFVFTHSDVQPETYPSTRQTADLLLSEVGLVRTPVDTGDERFGQTAKVDVKGFHVWSFRGANEDAHCSHIPHITEAIHLIEDAWNTPEMDRTVPFTPAPILGNPDGGVESETTPEAEAELEDEPTALAPPPETLAAALAPPAPHLDLLPKPAPAAPGVHHELDEGTPAVSEQRLADPP